jgi:hypothetical protein
MLHQRCIGAKAAAWAFCGNGTTHNVVVLYEKSGSKRRVCIQLLLCLLEKT